MQMKEFGPHVGAYLAPPGSANVICICLLDISIINVINIYDSIVLIVLPYELDNMQANSIESINCYHIGIIRSQ